MTSRPEAKISFGLDRRHPTGYEDSYTSIPGWRRKGHVTVLREPPAIVRGPLLRGYRLCRVNPVAEADLHGRILGEGDISPTPQKIRIDRTAPAVRTHYDTQRVRTYDQPDDNAHQLERRCSSGHRTSFAHVFLTAAADQRQSHRRSGGEIARLRRRSLGPTLGVELHILGCAPLDAFKVGIHSLRRSIGQNHL